jgi:predicted transcriptional regulator
MTAGAIAANFDTARPTVSKHLQILTECELLEQEQNGREIFYYINAKKMKEVADFIEPFRKMWDDRFNKLETIMKKYKSKNRIIWNKNKNQCRRRQTGISDNKGI